MEIADHNKPVAENIMRIIREKGLKQTFVAKNAGYTPQMLNDMLTGRRIIKVNAVAQATLEAVHNMQRKEKRSEVSRWRNI